MTRRRKAAAVAVPAVVMNALFAPATTPCCIDHSLVDVVGLVVLLPSVLMYGIAYLAVGAAPFRPDA